MVAPDAVGWLISWAVIWVAVVKIKELFCNFSGKSFPPTWRNFKDYLELRDHVRDYSDDGDVDQPRFGSERLSYDGLRGILTRRGQEAGVEEPALHDFRRAFALSMLRNRTDIFTLAKLMGHEGIRVLQRYLKQTNLDTEDAHRRAGPVDNGGLYNKL
jgi:integrase